MKKNLILMSALFAGAMFMNNGFGMNDGIPFDPTCDGVINYIMRENDNNRAITLQLRHIAQNPNWLDGLPRVDLIQLKNFVNSLSNDSFTRNGYIQTIDEHIQMVDEHIQALMQNNEAQNNVDGEILNQVQDGNIEEIEEDIAQQNNYTMRRKSTSKHTATKKVPLQTNFAATRCRTNWTNFVRRHKRLLMTCGIASMLYIDESIKSGVELFTLFHQ